MNDEKLIPKLRFAGFEEEWNSYFLEDVIKSFVNGQTPSRNVDSYWNGEIPWVSSGELNYNHITSTIEQITEEGKGKANLKLLPAGTFLMAITGLEAAGTRGSCAILDIEATTNQSCMALFPKEDKLTTKFLYYWYLKVGEHYGIKYTQGTKQQSYNKELLEKLPIVIPDNLKEQDKITDCLSLLHFKIELLEKKYKSYVDFKKYLMQQIFAQKLRFDFDEEWNNDTIGNNSEVFGRIGFRGYTVDDLVNKGEGALTIGGKHISKDYQLDLSDPEYLSWEKYEESPEIKIYNNDVLLVKTASVGKVCFIENLNEPATLNPQLIVFKNIKLNNKFFYYYLTSNLFQKDIHKIKSTTGIPTITQKELLNLNIIYPSLEEQEKIVNLLSIVDKKIFAIDKNIQDIKEFKKGLLQQMFI